MYLFIEIDNSHVDCFPGSFQWDVEERLVQSECLFDAAAQFIAFYSPFETFLGNTYQYGRRYGSCRVSGFVDDAVRVSDKRFSGEKKFVYTDFSPQAFVVCKPVIAPLCFCVLIEFDLFQTFIIRELIQRQMYDFSRKYEILKCFFFLKAKSEYKGLPNPDMVGQSIVLYRFFCLKVWF